MANKLFIMAELKSATKSKVTGTDYCFDFYEELLAKLFFQINETVYL